MRRFVILAAPRTGSNLLCSLLQSHPDVLCHHEVFNPNGIFVALPLRGTNFSLGSLAERNANPIKFLQRIWDSGDTFHRVGFKMTQRQQTEILNHICSDTQIHKIVLKRNGRLKTYVSRLLAERSGLWEDYRCLDKTTPARPVEVNYQLLQQSIASNDQYYADLDRMIHGPRTDLLYEELLTPQCQKKLLAALQLNQQPLVAQCRQQNPFPAAQLISNCQSLAKSLEENPGDQTLLEELLKD